MLVTDRRVLNFLVTGQLRCGASVVQSSIQSHPDVVCHSNLLNESATARKEAHEGYFGQSEDDGIPDFYWPGMLSPEQYLSSRVFDHPRNSERAVGIQLPYSELCLYQLWEYFHQWCNGGDFCAIHVKRNPIACYVSLKQAQASGVWGQSVNESSLAKPAPPVHGDLRELVRFIRQHAMCETRMKTTCDDRLEFSYRELFLDYHKVMAAAFEFLSLRPFPEARPSTRRLKNRNIYDRLVNFHELKAQAPYDVQEFFEDDLF